ncbi:hypothetical protein [Paraglaciecola sp. 2405UD69-4]|uniref:hypothetical protein n=1 Tax=Paraglaciecola sp. 2405UD69-4 TaxID=3391836 RepID=UPI0039C94E7A
MYSIFSLGVSELEVAQDESQNLTYKIALGYEFHRKWYVEAGYQQLGYDDLYTSALPTESDVIKGRSVKQGDALFLAFLGKASNHHGELFYRLGVLKTDIRGQFIQEASQECSLGKAIAIEVENYGSANLCDYNEGGAAAVLGLGFDFFIGARTLIRTEAEYIKGQNDLEMSALSIGLRYNF